MCLLLFDLGLSQLYLVLKWLDLIEEHCCLFGKEFHIILELLSLISSQVNFIKSLISLLSGLVSLLDSDLFLLHDLIKAFLRLQCLLPQCLFDSFLLLKSVLKVKRHLFNSLNIVLELPVL